MTAALAPLCSVRRNQWVCKEEHSCPVAFLVMRRNPSYRSFFTSSLKNGSPASFLRFFKPPSNFGLFLGPITDGLQGDTRLASVTMT